MTMNSEGRIIQRAELDQILSDLQYLNLTGSVQYDSSKWPIARDGFGDIYKSNATRQDGTNLCVAVKCLRIYLGDNRNTARNFRREIMAWSRLKHPNVLPLLGYALEEISDHVLQLPSLISEWMENDNILDFVKSNPTFDIDNVLVSLTGEAVIGGFSSVHAYYGGQAINVADVRGSIRWLAYELLAMDTLEPTKSSDAWAFGMTLYELLSRKRPFDHLRFGPQIIIAIYEGQLPYRPESFNEWPHSRKLLWSVCQSCWNKDPKSRPSMDDIVKQLESIITLQPMLDRQS